MRTFYFRLNISEVDSLIHSYQISYCHTNQAPREYRCTVHSLSFNTSYLLSIRAEGEYRWCYKDLLGRYSDILTVETSDFSK